MVIEKTKKRDHWIAVAKDKILWFVFTGFVGVLFSWGWWVTNSINERPTDQEVVGIVQTQAPYVEDRSMIFQMMKRDTIDRANIQDLIKSNTEAIINLRETIAEMRVFLKRQE